MFGGGEGVGWCRVKITRKPEVDAAILPYRHTQAARRWWSVRDGNLGTVGAGNTRVSAELPNAKVET